MYDSKVLPKEIQSASESVFFFAKAIDFNCKNLSAQTGLIVADKSITESALIRAIGYEAISSNFSVKFSALIASIRETCTSRAAAALASKAANLLRKKKSLIFASSVL